MEKEMKHAWAAELEVLAQIDKICSENGIPYFADSVETGNEKDTHDIINDYSCAVDWVKSGFRN